MSIYAFLVWSRFTLVSLAGYIVPLVAVIWGLGIPLERGYELMAILCWAPLHIMVGLILARTLRDRMDDRGAARAPAWARTTMMAINWPVALSLFLLQPADRDMIIHLMMKWVFSR